MNQKLFFSPTCCGGFFRDLGPPLRRQLVPTSGAALLAERHGGLVLAIVGSGVLIDLASQNLRDANSVGDGISGPLLALGASGHDYCAPRKESVAIQRSVPRFRCQASAPTSSMVSRSSVTPQIYPSGGTPRERRYAS